MTSSTSSGQLDGVVFAPMDRSKMADVASVPADLTPAVIVSCGSFSPPTVMHLRIFETARDYFRSMRDVHKVEIVGGFISPVHDKYGKASLVEAKHRVDMCKASVQTSDWIVVDEWETKQREWTRTRAVLQRFRAEINKNKDSENGGREIKVMLLCGADILDSMLKPGVWIDSDLRILLSDGIVCIKRAGSDPEKIIFESDLLNEFRHRIFLVRETVENHVSSTAVRRAVKRSQSIKYLVVDGVEKIITERRLWADSETDQPQAKRHRPA